MKKVFALLLAVLMLATTTACSKTSSSSSIDATTAATTTTADTATSEAETTTAAAFPLTITDQAGREVTISSQPQKIVSGYYISSSLLIALGLEDKIVGIEAKANKRPIYSLAAPELIDLPNVGTAKEFNLEGCAALEPDLVILPIKLKSAAASLEELGFATILVNPENDTLLTEMIDILGKATGTVEQADKLTEYIHTAKRALLNQIAPSSLIPSVYLAGNSDLLSTAGNKMYQSDMIALAGGRNVASDIDDTYWVEVSYEQLINWNPDYIILASDASYTVEDVLNNENLSQLSAVVSKQVYKLPADVESLDSPVPGCFLGSVWVASVIHSDYVTNDYALNAMKEFYAKFYDFEYQK